jgi:hypothetical protein
LDERLWDVVVAVGWAEEVRHPKMASPSELSITVAFFSADVDNKSQPTAAVVSLLLTPSAARQWQGGAALAVGGERAPAFVCTATSDPANGFSIARARSSARHIDGLLPHEGFLRRARGSLRWSIEMTRETSCPEIEGVSRFWTTLLPLHRY